MEKRIVAAPKGKLNDMRVTNKVKRVENYIKVAKTNTEEKKYKAQEELDSLMVEFAEDRIECTTFINCTSNLLLKIDAAEEELKQLNRVMDYLNEEVGADK